jgi:hypothetical protein
MAARLRFDDFARERRFRSLANFPILAAAHDWDTVHKTM